MPEKNNSDVTDAEAGNSYELKVGSKRQHRKAAKYGMWLRTDMMHGGEKDGITISHKT
jgi:hypothetical protein